MAGGRLVWLLFAVLAIAAAVAWAPAPRPVVSGEGRELTRASLTVDPGPRFVFPNLLREPEVAPPPSVADFPIVYGEPLPASGRTAGQVADPLPYPAVEPPPAESQPTDSSSMSPDALPALAPPELPLPRVSTELLLPGDPVSVTLPDETSADALIELPAADAATILPRLPGSGSSAFLSNESLPSDFSPSDEAIEPAGPSLNPSAERELPMSRSAPSRFVPPTALYEQLDRVVAELPGQDWALEVRRLVRELTGAPAPDTARTSILFDQIARQLRFADEQIALAGESSPAAQLRRLRHAVERRLDVWQELERLGNGPRAAAHPDADRLMKRLDAVSALTRRTDTEWRTALSQWRSYLLVDELRTIAPHAARLSEQDRKLAQTALYRLDSPRLEPAQRRFTERPEPTALREELRHWAYEPAELEGLCLELEQYESNGSLAEPFSVGQRMYRLGSSPDAGERRLAVKIDEHYRMPNVRVLVTRALVNYLLPQPERLEQPVAERILNTPVRGRSRTDTALAVRFLPSEERLRMMLEASGNVAAWTTTDAGAALLRNASQTTFRVEKPLEISTHGVLHAPAEASVANVSRLRGVSTEFQNVPILGAIVEGVVRDRYMESRDAARQEVETKVAAEVERRVDGELNDQIANFNQHMQDEFLAPLRALRLGPDIVSRLTTTDHLVARLRIADSDHLAANTPRPADPDYCLAGIQFHESAANNFLRALQLEGRTFTPAELRAWIKDKLSDESEQPVAADEADDEDLLITFADRDAVQVRFQDNSVAIRFRFAEFDHEGRVWEDFEARVVYRPEHSRAVALVRDPTISFAGLPSGARGQITLRTVFSKLFPPDKTFPLIPPRLADHPRLPGLTVQQLVLADGWASVHWWLTPSPELTAQREARRQK